MIKVEYALLCDHVILDQQGKFSFIGVFQNLTVDRASEFRYPIFYVCVGILGIDNGDKVSIKLVPRNKKDVSVSIIKDQEISVQNKDFAVPIAAAAISQPFLEKGMWDVVVSVKDKEGDVSVCGFEVKQPTVTA